MTAPATPAALSAASAEQVDTSLFRALAVVRVVVIVYMVALNAARWDEFERPGLAWTIIGALVVWSGIVTWAYDDARRRRTPLLVADLTVTCLALLATPFVHSAAMLERQASTLPAFWVMSAVLAWAVARGWPGGVVAATVVSACDLSVRTQLTGTTWGNIFLLLLAAGVVGYAATLVREAVETRARAERVRAAIEERARLARVVHDGVLQVLALVQRHGASLGGEAAELGRLAGEQEVALRALVQADARSTDPEGPEAGGERDLVGELTLLGSPTVTVSGPGSPVALPAHTADELVSVVRACLDNVRHHVAEDAPAWVLVEDLGASVVVTVRDEGPGIPADRLAAASAEGRLGVSESVRGRVADLGGTAVLVTGPGQGTEWELTVPRDGPRDRGGTPHGR